MDIELPFDSLIGAPSFIYPTHIRDGRHLSALPMDPSLYLDFLSGDFDSRITMSRADPGTRFNALGVLETVAANLPRLDYDPVTLARLGLLVERVRTNSFTRSSEFEHADWSKTNTTITSNALAAPDGTTTADLWARDSTAAAFTNNFSGKAAAAEAWSSSFHVRASVGDYCALRIQSATAGNRADTTFRFSTGTFTTAPTVTGTFTGASATARLLSNGWWRISLTVTTDASAFIVGLVSFSSNGTDLSGVDSVANSAGHLWGAQLELGPTVTSYIPTTSAQVTRNNDLAKIIAPSFAPWFNALEGTLLVEANTYAETEGGQVLAALTDGTNNEAITMTRVFGGSHRADVRDGNVSQASMNTGAMAANTVVKAAVAYKANDFATCHNGGTVLTDVAGTLPTVNSLNIGNDPSSSTLVLNGWIRRLSYFPVKLTNAQLQRITT